MTDEFFLGGNSYTKVAPIDGTTFDKMYHSERNALTGDFSYAIPALETGRTYKIVMHFAELYFTDAEKDAEKRVFDVVLEGETVLNDFDLVKEVGAFTATEYSFERVITDGSIDVEIISKSDYGKINGLEVFMLPEE